MDTSQALRRAFGKFATGIAVVTTSGEGDRPCGLTINSFSSVSLKPPLVLWSLTERSPNLSTFLNASHFAINILSGDQRTISDQFASKADDRFAGIDWFRGINGLPVIRNTIATFECRRTQTVNAGDHVVFFGEVEASEQCDLEPLLFFSGQYGTARLPPDPGAGPKASSFADGYLLHLLATANEAVSIGFHSELSGDGISLSTWRILIALYPESRLNVGSLARMCLLKQPTLTRTLDRLEHAGLVRRNHAAGDRRGVLVELTDQGREIAAGNMAKARRHEQEVLKHYSEAEIQDLKQKLRELPKRTKYG